MVKWRRIPVLVRYTYDHNTGRIPADVLYLHASAPWISGDLDVGGTGDTFMLRGVL